MRLTRFARDQRGAAAVEFALLAPVMVLLYFGLVELTEAMMAERRASHAASVMADLVAQSAQISNTDLDDIFHVSQQIMQPFPAGPLKMRLTSVTANAQGTPKADWSRASGMSALQAGTTVAGMPTGLLAAGDSVIRADVSYAFTSPIGAVLPQAVTYSETFYLRPRRGTQVTIMAG